LLSSSEEDLLQQLLEAVVSKHARDDGSGKVTFILQKHKQMSARSPFYQTSLVETAEPAAAASWLVISSQAAAL